MRRRTRTTAARLIMGAAILASACGGGRTAPAAGMVPARVDAGPELVECAGYRPPPGGVGAIRAVEVQYVVMETGLVDPASISILQRPQAPPAVQDDLIQRARDAARNCQYIPAHEDGRPVAARVRRTFRFLI